MTDAMSTQRRAYGTSSNQRIDELRKFIARAYSEFIDHRGSRYGSVKRSSGLHDPLFAGSARQVATTILNGTANFFA